jgi:hypothetical protein
MEKNTFIAKAVNELLDDGFSIKLIMTRAIDGKYGGWFDDNKDQKEFVVAMKRDCAFEIFVHEYSHYLQWKHHRKFFNSKVKGCDILFNWLDGKRYSKKIVSQAVKDAIELEWHCECIALQTIKKYKLDIDVDNYTRGANCYLFFYHTVEKLRSWTKNSKSPYSPALRKLSSTQLHSLDFYLDPNNYNDKLKKRHEKICSQL